MRILHVSFRLAEADGGPPTSLINLAPAQVNLGDEITILPCSSCGGKAIIEAGKYGNLTVLPSPTDSILKLPNKAVKETLLDITKNFDIVHIHGSWRYHLVAASYAARKHDIPYIVRPAGNLGCIPRNKKVYIKKPYFWVVEKPILDRAAAIHCCTKKELDEIKQVNIKAKHFVVPNPVDASLVHSDTQPERLEQICPGLQSSDSLLVYLGRIVSIKQIPILLEAFVSLSREYKNVKLALAGPWEDRKLKSFLQSRIEREQLQNRVYMPGMVKGDVKTTLLHRATVFVQPSSHENFGLSVVEALSCGKSCVVSSGVGVSCDIAKTGAGLVFDGGAEQLSEALRKILSDRIFREKCEQNAIELSNNFKPVVVAKRLKERYNQCLNDI